MRVAIRRDDVGEPAAMLRIICAEKLQSITRTGEARGRDRWLAGVLARRLDQGRNLLSRNSR